MNYETDKQSVYHFTMLFLYRRLLFAFTLAFCKVSIVLQVYIIIFSSLGLLCYVVHWQPMEADQYDFLAIFNEAVLLICAYMLLVYTEYVPSPEMRYEFGNYFLYMLFFNFGLNILLLFNEILRMVRRECKKRRHHKKIRRDRKLKVQGDEKKKQAAIDARCKEYEDRKRKEAAEE